MKIYTYDKSNLEENVKYACYSLNALIYFDIYTSICTLITTTNVYIINDKKCRHIPMQLKHVYICAYVFIHKYINVPIWISKCFPG
jgi:hypothetical protein